MEDLDEEEQTRGWTTRVQIMLPEVLAQYDKEIMDDPREDGAGHLEVEEEQDEVAELGISHIIDSGDEHEMDEFESLLQFLEQVFTMLEVVEDECTMETIQQRDDWDEDDYEELHHSLQSLEQMELTD